ncbi:MAG: DNA repair protein RecO [Bacilli bacterium]
MQRQLEGIVLRSIDYGENNRILTVYTREMGKVSLLARGAKKPKSKYSAIAQPFLGLSVVASFGLNNGMGTIDSADVTNRYRTLMTDIVQCGYASFLAELVWRAVEDGRPSSGLYTLLSEAFTAIDEGQDAELVSFMFQLHLFHFLGCSPYLQGCASCQSTDILAGFSISEGGYLCQNCIAGARYPFHLTGKQLKFLSILSGLRISQLGDANVSVETRKKVDQICAGWLNYYTGIVPKSKRFLEQLDLLK